jgi:hypothetical protein
MREVGRNYTSGITFDIANEVRDPSFLNGGPLRLNYVIWREL